MFKIAVGEPVIEWQPILEAGIKSLAPKIIDSAISAGQKSFKDRAPYNKLTFNSHLQYAYNRCTKIKTIVNGDDPINLLENYVNPDFKFKNKSLDEYTFIDKIFEQKHISLTGSPGSGKSMFMRYLWICCSVHPRGKIPIYVELRKYNDITYDDFITWIYHLVVDEQNSETRPLFDRSVKEGQFIFILDGFDEVRSAKREGCEKAILKLSESTNVVIVSGRPDDTYHSWQMFCLYEMMPLKLTQTIKLIENIDFDRTVKKKFINKLKSGLYEQHKSFASRPLLATMMLLTFSSYADIPEKIHVFYDQAFDTLFSRHDATKEAFKRERKTDYSIDVFKKYFSLFCLLTYNDAANDFSEATVLETLRTVGKFENTQLTAELFLKDLLDAVCLLQKDGLKYVFSHRSFQEYFTAYSLARLPESKVGELLKRFSSRPSDSVIPMLFDMNRGLVERAYLDQALDDYIEATNCIKPFNGIEYTKVIEVALFIQYLKAPNFNSVLGFFIDNNSPRNHLRDLVCKLYHKTDGSERTQRQSYEIYLTPKDVLSFERDVLPLMSSTFTEDSGSIIYQDQKIMLNRRIKKARSSKSELVNITSSDRIKVLQTWLLESDWFSDLRVEHEHVMQIAADVKNVMQQREKTMEEILGL